MRPKRSTILTIRIGASVAMLVFLYTRIPDFEFSQLLPDRRIASALWLAAAVTLTIMGFALSALRWKQVLAAMGLPVGFRQLLRHYLAGQFVSNVLPTTIGGDVLRVTRLARENGESPRTFASVVLERLTGWLVLPLLTFIGFIVNPGLRNLGLATKVAIALAVGTLAALVLVLFAAANRRMGRRLADQANWQRFIGAVHLGVDQLRRHPGAAASVIAVGFAYQFVLVLAALAAANVIGISDVGLTALLAFLPAVLIAQVLPIGIAGLGVREGAFVLFLGPLGVPDEQAIALGLLLYILNAATSALGAPAFAFGPRSDQAVA